MSGQTKLGLDWIDLLIHIGATIFLMIIAVSIGEAVGGPMDEALLAVVGALSLILLAIRRRRALAASPRDDADAARLAEIEDRLGALEHAEDRLLELEERLDFAERLLAQVQAPERLPHS